MTASVGIIHEEYHSPAFGKTGSPFKMVQLWVNLPAKDKMAPGGYQGITAAEIPTVELPGGAGLGRVIAGELLGTTGPARTFTPINVWEYGRASCRDRVCHCVEISVVAVSFKHKSTSYQSITFTHTY